MSVAEQICHDERTEEITLYALARETLRETDGDAEKAIKRLTARLLRVAGENGPLKFSRATSKTRTALCRRMTPTRLNKMGRANDEDV